MKDLRSVLAAPRLEWPCLAVVLLVVLIYVVRLDDLTIRGEESRRATVAMEMLATGDWIVPRQQGDPFFMSSRPPLQAWTIAAVGSLRGQVDAAAIRLPSVLAVLLTSLVIYGYARTFLSQLGAFAAATVFVTMGQVMELGRLGETDALFTLLLSSALLTWHWGFTRGWSPSRTWTTAYLFAALATLTKGPQAPVYFVAGTGVYLLGTRNWRYAFTRAHAVGIAAYMVVVGAWLVPFAMQMGSAGVRHVFTGDVALYLADWRITTVARHYAAFPFVVLASLLPWSMLLVTFSSREFRATLGRASPHARFLWGAIAIAFPTVWLIPDTRPRFFMSMYPCFALLVGIVVERCFEARADSRWRTQLRHFTTLLAASLAVVAVGLPIAKWQGGDALTADQTWTWIVAASLIAAVLGIVLWRSRHGEHIRHWYAAVLAVAGCAGLAFTGLYTNSLISRSERVDLAMEALLHDDLPETATLVSFGPVHHLFAYYYGAHHGKPIEMLPTPTPDRLNVAAVEYFCTEGELPFEFETVAKICCDRNRSNAAQAVVTIGWLPSHLATRVDATGEIRR
jgi:4-amino-4-deoxy-L-arabinose transferase-like glycosyltransferase